MCLLAGVGMATKVVLVREREGERWCMVVERGGVRCAWLRSERMGVGCVVSSPAWGMARRVGEERGERDVR